MNAKERLIRSIVMLSIAVPSALSADDYPFGRVFTTPEQRDKIDRLESGGGPVDSGEQKSASKQEQAAKIVKFSGLLVQENGEAIAWIQGRDKKIQQEKVGRRLSHSQNTRNKHLSITVSESGKRKRLKPGQLWYVNDNAVKEAYEVEHNANAESIASAASDSDGAEGDSEQ